MYARAFRPGASAPTGFALQVLEFPPSARAYRIHRIDLTAGHAGVNGVSIYTVVKGRDEEPTTPTSSQMAFGYPDAFLALAVSNGLTGSPVYGPWELIGSLWLVGYVPGTVPHDVGIGVEYELYKPERQERAALLAQ